MLNKTLARNILDLIKKPHLSDFPYHLFTNPIGQFRTYRMAEEVSITYLYAQNKQYSKFYSKLNSFYKFKKTKYFSDRSPPVPSITYTQRTQTKNQVAGRDENLQAIEIGSKKISTLLIYVDGLSPCLLETSQGENAVMKNTSEIFKKGFIHNKYFSASEWTLPNLASMFLGLLPSQHGLTNSGSNSKSPYLIPKYPNIFQFLSNYGIKTNVFSSVPYMNPNFGFHLGTDKFFYHKNLSSRELLPQFRNFVQERKIELNQSYLDCVFLMDVHHKLNGNLAKWDSAYSKYVENISQKTRLSIHDTRNLISRAVELDMLLKTLFNHELLEHYDHVVLISDHGSARLRESQELCVDDARTRATFCLLSKSDFTVDTNNTLSLAALPTVISRLFELPIFPSPWTEENDVIFTQAIFPKHPYRLRIRTQDKHFDFIGEQFWLDHQSFEFDLKEFLDRVSIHLGHSKCIEDFKKQIDFRHLLI